MFQKLDQHHALAFPFDNPPNEVVSGRTKDIPRFKLLDARYPVNPDIKLMNKFKQEFNESLFYTHKLHYIPNTCLGGETAYAFLYDLMNTLLGSLKAKLTKAGIADTLAAEFKKLVPAKVDFLDGEQFMISLPKSIDPILTIITDNPQTVFPPVGSSFYSPSGIKRQKEPEVTIVGEAFFNRYLDLKPRTRDVVIQQNETTKLRVEILDNKGHLTPCSSITQIVKTLKSWEIIWAKETKENWLLSNVNNVLTHFLLKYFIEEKSKKSTFLNLYWSLSRLVWIAEQITQVHDFQTKMPYFLTAETYGKYNWDYTYLTQQKEREGQTQLRPPFGYYPDSKLVPPTFDPSKSWVFKIDGEKTDSIPEIKLFD
jgi:hypothetical protein